MFMDTLYVVAKQWSHMSVICNFYIILKYTTNYTCIHVCIYFQHKSHATLQVHCSITPNCCNLMKCKMCISLLNLLDTTYIASENSALND